MDTFTVSTYQLKTSTGRPIRQATQVTCPDGTVIRFIEKVSKAEAIRQAKYQKGKA